MLIIHLCMPLNVLTFTHWRCAVLICIEAQSCHVFYLHAHENNYLLLALFQRHKLLIKMQVEMAGERKLGMASLRPEFVSCPDRYFSNFINIDSWVCSNFFWKGVKNYLFVSVWVLASSVFPSTFFRQHFLSTVGRSYRIKASKVPAKNTSVSGLWCDFGVKG